MASITSEEARILSALPRTEGYQKLITCLKQVPIDHDDPQGIIILDYLYENLMFACQMGFPWTEVCSIFGIAHEMLNETKGIPISDAILLFKKKCDACKDVISDSNIKQYANFLFSTFLTHFKLYQYVLNCHQDKHTHVHKVHVETPPDSSEMCQTISVELWDYQQKVKKIEEEEKLKNKEHEEERLSIFQEDEESIKTQYGVLNQMDASADKENLLDIIEKVAEACLCNMSHTVAGDITSTFEKLQFKLEKNIIPRPQELGPPQLNTSRTPQPSGKGKK